MTKEPVNSDETIRRLKEYLLRKYNERNNAPRMAFGDQGSLVEQWCNEEPKPWPNCVSVDSQEYKKLKPTFPKWMKGKDGNDLTKLEYYKQRKEKDGLGK